MAEASIPTPSLSEASVAEAHAPNSLAGWSEFQREVNVILPLRLGEMDTVLQQVDRVLAGLG